MGKQKEVLENNSSDNSEVAQKPENNTINDILSMALAEAISEN